MLLYEAWLLVVVQRPIDEIELELQLSKWHQSVLDNGWRQEFRFSAPFSK